MELIYNEFYISMCGQALWIVRSSQDAEDVASEALLKLIKHAQGECTPVKDCGAFMYTLVRNTAFDFLRKRKNTVQLNDEDIAADSGDCDYTDKIVVAEAMKSLSEIDFKIAEMFYYYDCKIKTIAASTGLSVSAVKWHLYEIRKKHKKVIADD